mmetsp:Transcript_86983/g.243853  ORF Transcript_86983/g.243853 Transcript_86983/m.243853 type:complete len:392 (+) Transcript_86983:132-1307(+)
MPNACALLTAFFCLAAPVGLLMVMGPNHSPKLLLRLSGMPLASQEGELGLDITAGGRHAPWEAGINDLMSSGHPKTCGVVIEAWGLPTSKYVTWALTTIRRLRATQPSPGWCRADPELVEIPITLVTDLAPKTVALLLETKAQASTASVRVDSGSSFDPVPPIAARSQMTRLGPVQYRWFHCQVFTHAPYDLMLYLDSDATICTVDAVADLFRAVADNGVELGYKVSSHWWHGYGSTHGNPRDPHPADVTTEADIASWARQKEANAGAVIFASRHPAATKFAADWCRYLKESLVSEDVAGDQYSFRAALWAGQASLSVRTFRERASPREEWWDNRICRHQANCTHGCSVVHDKLHMATACLESGLCNVTEACAWLPKLCREIRRAWKALQP